MHEYHFLFLGWGCFSSNSRSESHRIDRFKRERSDWERLQVLGQEMGRDGHELHRCLYTTLNVNTDVAQAERELRAFIESYYSIPYEVQATRNGLCAGSAEHCIAWLKAFVAAGAQTIVVRFGSPDQMGQLVRFAREVLPGFDR